MVGMHRSGTSALCAALQAGGASFGVSLLDPMQGVNDEGFWEDESVVAINERLLQELGLHWYSVSFECARVDWASQRFDGLRKEAGALLTRGFGEAAVEVVKDPRFCLTLPFWLEVSKSCELDTRVCVISRAPLEVAASLQKRDGFPLSYGLRLAAVYRQAIVAQAPEGAVYLRYTDLLQDPVQLLSRLGEEAGLALDFASPAVSGAVRHDLRHQASGDAGNGPLHTAGDSSSDLAALRAVLEADYSTDVVICDLAEALVARGRQLSTLGIEHSETLATLDERDADVARLAAELAAAVTTVAERDRQIEEFDRRLADTGGHLEQALQTIQERDGQITEFDRRLAEIGRMHAEALALIEARDAQLQRVFGKPGVGLLFRAMWSRESR